MRLKSGVMMDIISSSPSFVVLKGAMNKCEGILRERDIIVKAD